MTRNLPARSSSRAIQNRHLRRYASGKVALVNPTVKKSSPVNQVDQRKIDSINKTIRAAKEKRIIKKEELKPKARINWAKPPLEVPSIGEMLDEMDFYPSKNQEEFAINYIEKPLQRIQEEYNKGEITREEATKEIKEVKEEANAVMESSEMEPDATIVYGPVDDKTSDRGHIGTYTQYEADGIEVKWISNGYRGYNEVVLPEDSKWEILHEDNILSMSNDERNLKTFSEELEQELGNRNIEFATVFTTSSNVFSQGITFLIEKGRSEEVNDIVEDLKKQYRKEEDYDKEINPLYDAVKALKEKGQSQEEIKKAVAEKTTPETKKVLEKAIKEAFK